ncbi:vWA domain-containing protein [Vibrio fluminensis]|uniref:vWA domain-containing protein n=1 Tax=Vibrio fluminensis TaxID=2783614 RepID=UPI0018872684|nr:vWA domain-containing protein [Vibrio fluminensis]
MKNLYCSVAMGLAAISLGGCSEAETKITSAIKSVSGVKGESYAFRGADQSWPGAGNADLVLADNKDTANYYVIFDGSGSMQETECGNGSQRIEVAKQAVGTFFDALPKNANVGLIIFDAKGTRNAVPLKPNDPDLLKSFTNDSSFGGGTPLGYTLDYAYKELMKQGQMQQGYGEFNIVVLTDGAASDPDDMEKAIEHITYNSPVSLHTIGFCLGDSHALNKKGVINYQPAANAAELVKGLQSVLAESPSFDTASFDGDQS